MIGRGARLCALNPDRSDSSMKIAVNHRWHWLLAASLLVGGGAIAVAPISRAHEVQISGNVGGTMHIEPRDNPRAGTASRTWFALTRRGGQSISLSSCHCQLALYAQPRRRGDAAIARPTLTAISTQGRQGVPSANLTFPRAGAYQVVLSGRPVTNGAFTPFELRFSVTVAR